jgi:hypothetical protein
MYIYIVTHIYVKAISAAATAALRPPRSRAPEIARERVA